MSSTERRSHPLRITHRLPDWLGGIGCHIVKGWIDDGVIRVIVEVPTCPGLRIELNSSDLLEVTHG